MKSAETFAPCVFIDLSAFAVRRYAVPVQRDAIA
jgi:hypothetical protein